MRFTKDFSEYEPWSGAVETYNKILRAGMLDKLEAYLEDVFVYENPEETQINDLLWFEGDDVLEALGLLDDEDNEEFKEVKENEEDRDI